MGVYWFVVPMCSGSWGWGNLWIGCPKFFGEDCRPSAGGYLGLAGEELIFFTCSEHIMRNAVFPCRL